MTIMSLFMLVLYILLAIAVVVLLYLVTMWVLRLLGVTVDARIITVIFVILGLLAVIGAISGGLSGWQLRLSSLIVARGLG